MVAGEKFQIAEDALLKACFDVLFVEDCCLRSVAVEKRSILACDIRWKRLRKYAGVEVGRNLKVENAISKAILDCTGSQLN